MSHEFLASLFTSGGARAVLIAAVLLAPTSFPVAGQAPAATAKVSSGKTWTQLRTPDGQPNLEGMWSNATTTPLVRPAAFSGKQVLTEEETAELNAQIAKKVDRDRRAERGTAEDLTQAYNEVWWERGKALNRTSLIIDPANGNLPPLTPEGRKAIDARSEATRGHGPADSWLDRPLNERCLLNHAVPPLPTGYNNNYQIVQTPGYVVIVYEMVQGVRIIPLDERPHIAQNIRQWLGDSRGRWEGNTLVIETTNFRDQPDLFKFPASGARIRVVERLTRVDADHIDYRFTIDDPATYVSPWTAILPMTKTAGPIYEYACHEANYGLMGILAGARAEEKAAEATAKQGSK